MTICVTSIHEPNQDFLEYCRIYNAPIYWVGDRKTPPVITPFVKSITLQEQLDLTEFSLPRLLPQNHYSRKNIGYLLAILNGAEWVLDTDDDNFPKIPYRRFPVETTDADLLTGATGRVNVYKYYTRNHVWPRGLGYQFDEANPLKIESSCRSVAVWQGLADGDPDVDAVYRLANLGSVFFDPAPVVILDKGLYCPFNSQNTMWNARFLAYAYLPSTVTFRFTDILRGYVAQRAFWAHESNLGFVGPNVLQDRNEHDLLRDLESELIMYKSIDSLLAVLEGVSLTVSESDNLSTIYEALASAGIVEPQELDLLNAWLSDLSYARKCVS